MDVSYVLKDRIGQVLKVLEKLFYGLWEAFDCAVSFFLEIWWIKISVDLKEGFVGDRKDSLVKGYFHYGEHKGLEGKSIT